MLLKSASFSMMCISVDIQHSYRLLPGSMMRFSVILLRRLVSIRHVVKKNLDLLGPLIVFFFANRKSTLEPSHSLMMHVYLSIAKNGRSDFRMIRIPQVISVMFCVKRYLKTHRCRSEMCTPLYSASIVGSRAFFFCFLEYLNNEGIISLVHYSRLVMFSFGFQQAYQRGFDQGDIIFFTTVCIFLVYNDPYLLILIDISV
jgi:hypothetical protein